MSALEKQIDASLSAAVRTGVEVFAIAVKAHLAETIHDWAAEREEGNSEMGFWTVGHVVDIDKLNAQIDKFAAEFKALVIPPG